MAKITNMTAGDTVRVHDDTEPAAPLLEALAQTVAELGDVAAGDELTLAVTRAGVGRDDRGGWADYSVAASTRSAISARGPRDSWRRGRAPAPS